MMKKRRVYTAEFRQEALSLLERSGKRTYEIEPDLGITHGLLYKWQRRYSAKADNANEQVTASVKELEAEIRRLKRENAILQEERTILKKAVKLFSQELG
ncbi:MAG: transposase [Anaerolineae bacterium]|nr:transposase [Anaerolineae bacterium]